MLTTFRMVDNMGHLGSASGGRGEAMAGAQAGAVVLGGRPGAVEVDFAVAEEGGGGVGACAREGREGRRREWADRAQAQRDELDRRVRAGELIAAAMEAVEGV